jgi:prepilin-type N-terminal cleavage/methylation domain-containing protein
VRPKFLGISRSRQGFTLIELLVVIAIIAILIALLVPAVQKVRAAAARTPCSNNLKQIGLACHGYHDAFKRLPQGYVCNAKNQPQPGWVWSVLILPYLEQDALYKNLNPDLQTPNGPPYPVAPANAALTQNPLPTYLCPSDVNNNTINVWYDNYAKSNYACNRAIFGPNFNTNGPLNLKLTDITDGTSNTIMVGERDSYQTFAAIWIAGRSPGKDNSTASFEGRPGKGLNKPYKAAGPFPPNSGDNVFNFAARLEWSSQHTGEVGFVFADGSVHFLQEGIDADPTDNWDDSNWATKRNFTLQNLYWPQDGFSVNETSF